MMYHDADGIRELAGEARDFLIMLAIFLFLGLGNTMLPQNRRDSEFRTRLVLALAVLLFLPAICTVIIQDRAILINLWRGSPVLYSLVYLIACALGIWGLTALFYWKLRPKLWRRHRESDS
ncbi:MAG: hypothetical protein WBE76_01865 [Terracidiphilus sp.]